MNGDTVSAGQYSRQHQQPQFRGPARRRRAHLAGESADRRGERGSRQDHRSAGVAVMEPLKRVRSQAPSSSPSSNVDTDQIIPARFLTTTTKEGLGKQLFADWRYRADGTPNPDFVLNRAGGARLPGAGGRPQLRLRLLARACALGASRLRHSRRHQHRDRRYLSQQFLEERSAADHGGRGHRGLAARTPGRRGRHRSRDRAADAADRRRSRLPNRGLRAPLPAERDRRARLPAQQAGRHRALRSARRGPGEGDCTH